MSLAEYAPTAWTDYADSPDLEASFLNHIELGIEAVTDELIAFEAWAASHYQPVSAELTAISGLSTPGYVRRTGPGAYVAVASIPVADVSGLSLQAAYDASTAPQITTTASKGALIIRNGSGIEPASVLEVQASSGAPMVQLGGTGDVTFHGRLVQGVSERINAAGDAFFGQLTAGGIFARPDPDEPTVFANIYGDGVASPSSSNWSLSIARTGSGTYLKGTTVSILAGNVARVTATSSGVALAGTVTVPSLGGAGFVRSNSGNALSSSALVAGDIPALPYLPLAAGAGSPLTGVLYGQMLNFTTTADAPITISQNLAGGFTHPLQAFNSGMVAGNQYNFDFGQSASTNNAGNFGFKYVGAGSSSNYVTLGMYGANDLLTITAAGVPKFSGLTASKFVKTDASKNLISTDVAYSDLTGTVPTWNQSTTGTAATATKWATARNLTIGSSTQALDGTTALTFSLAAIGAQAAGSYLTPSNVSGAVSQMAFFNSANAVGGSSRMKYVESASNTSIDLIGGNTQARITMVPPGTRMTHIYAASGGVGFRESDLDGLSNQNWPISWVPGAGGTLTIDRPLTLGGLAGTGTRVATISPSGVLGAVTWSTGVQTIATNSSIGSATARVLFIASGVSLTLSGGTDGESWEMAGLASWSLVVPSGVHLRTYNNSYSNMTLSFGGGRPLRIIRASSSEWWSIKDNGILP